MVTLSVSALMVRIPLVLVAVSDRTIKIWRVSQLHMKPTSKILECGELLEKWIP